MLIKIFLVFVAVAAVGCGVLNTSVADNSNSRIAEATPTNGRPDTKPSVAANGPTPKAVTPSDIPFSEDVVISMKRGECYGNCPQYLMSIYGSGKVDFEGIKDTLVNGKTSGTISSEEVKQLVGEFAKIGFLELEDDYDAQNCPTYATDQSTVVISLTAGGKTKTINHYTGCVENDEKYTPYPTGLLALENKIHEIPEAKKWTGPR
jgi:hypothetical protein